LDRVAVAEFLGRTEELVPVGGEDDHFDVDALIAELTRV
jgi:hypothetical protein